VLEGYLEELLDSNKKTNYIAHLNLHVYVQKFNKMGQKFWVDRSKALFRPCLVCKMDIIALSFVFDKYYLIMD
jgi:hypothetical protein